MRPCGADETSDVNQYRLHADWPESGLTYLQSVYNARYPRDSVESSPDYRELVNSRRYPRK
jgi:hypothetical protein